MQCVRTLHTGGRLEFCAYAAISGGFQTTLPAAGMRTLSLVPTQLQRVIELRGGVEALRSYDALLIGGAAVSNALLAKARSYRLPIVVGYGMTETAAMIAAQSSADFLSGQPLAGRLFPGVAAHIEQGQIYLQSPSLCLGIYPELRADGAVYPTGDEGLINERGELLVTGRLDRIINTGGEKVDPQEVESALLCTGQVSECAVVAKPDPTWGAIVVALFVPSPSFRKVEDVKAAAQKHLAGYQIPKDWIPVDALPRMANGKLDRQRLMDFG